MTRFLITAIALAIPAYFYTGLVRSIDRFEKEPPAYLIAAFVWGAVPAVIMGIILQVILGIPVRLWLGDDTLSSQLIEASLSAPITEEFLKGMAVAIIFLTRRREFDGWVDGIVYGAMAGFGFAYVENILYLMNTETWQDWIGLFCLRTLVFGGLHGFWTAITGIGFGVARYIHNPVLQILAIAACLVTAMFGHFIHNTAATLVDMTSGASLLVALFNYFVLLLFMGGLWLIAGYLDRQRLKTYLRDEVPHPLPPDYYTALCQSRSHAFKTLSQLGLTPQQQREFWQLAAELAQKKLQLSKMGEEDGNSAEIHQLRQALTAFTHP